MAKETIGPLLKHIHGTMNTSGDDQKKVDCHSFDKKRPTKIWLNVVGLAEQSDPIKKVNND